MPGNNNCPLNDECPSARLSKQGRASEGWEVTRTTDIPEKMWSQDITESLIDRDRPYDLYVAGRDWPDSRWDPRIAEKLAESGSSKDINDASREWPEDRLEVLRDALRRTKARFE